MFQLSNVVFLCVIVMLFSFPVWAELQKGLVGCWSFEDPDHIGADSSTYEHNGTVNGNGVSQVSGIGGQAAQFDGTSVIEVAATSALNTTDAISVSYWFKSSQSVPSSGSVSIVRHDGHFTAGQLRDSKNICAIAFPSVGSYFKVATTWNSVLNNNQWHHVAAVYGSGSLNIYVDGQLTAGNNDLTEQ